MTSTSAHARFGIAVDSDNGVHVRFRLFAATGGQYLSGCGQLVMRTDEFAAFRELLEPALTDRPDPPPALPPIENDPVAKRLGIVPCCDLHGINCEPPSELCCQYCTEAGHPNHPNVDCVLRPGGAS